MLILQGVCVISREKFCFVCCIVFLILLLGICVYFASFTGCSCLFNRICHFFGISFYREKRSLNMNITVFLLENSLNLFNDQAHLKIFKNLEKIQPKAKLEEISNFSNLNTENRINNHIFLSSQSCFNLQRESTWVNSPSVTHGGFERWGESEGGQVGQPRGGEGDKQHAVRVV